MNSGNRRNTSSSTIGRNSPSITERMCLPDVVDDGRGDVDRVEGGRVDRRLVAAGHREHAADCERQQGPPLDAESAAEVEQRRVGLPGDQAHEVDDVGADGHVRLRVAVEGDVPVSEPGDMALAAAFLPGPARSARLRRSRGGARDRRTPGTGRGSPPRPRSGSGRWR